MMDDGIWLSPEEIIRKIENFGFEFYIGEDGAVHGRPIFPGTRMPMEGQRIVDQMRMQEEAVKKIVREREMGIVDLEGIGQDEAAEWMGLVLAGTYRLAKGTTVVYHSETGLTDMKLEKVNA